MGRFRPSAARPPVKRAASGRRPLGVLGPSDALTPGPAALVLLALVVLATLAAFANGRLLAWDVPVRDAIRSLDPGWVPALMRWATRLGSRWVIAGLSLPMIALVWSRCRQLAVVLAGALPGALAIELVLKTLVDRPRPAPGIGFGASFPSGHVLAAAAFWGLLPPWTYLVTRRRGAWLGSAVVAGGALIAVGASRVWLGAHWPSDVLGGYLVGAVLLMAAEWAVRRSWPVLHCESCDLHPLRRPGTGDGPPGGGGRSPSRRHD